MTKREGAIGWINESWHALEEVTIPITDRGVNLGDGIFETILIYKGAARLLTNHLNRWKKSASLMKLAQPPSDQWIESLINEGIKHIDLKHGNGIARLNWTRGSSSTRGIDIFRENQDRSNHRFWLEISHGNPCFNAISTTISCNERRNANSELSACKIIGYGQSIKARYEAMQNGYDDALLLSTNGKICSGTTANLIIKRKDEWLTPSLSSGCLPGIMRQQGLDLGIFKEADLTHAPQKEDEWLLLNSLGCRAIQKINNQSLKIFPNPKQLWLSLIV